MCRFGGPWIVRGGEDLERVTGPLGPDAMAVGRDESKALLARRRGALRPALMAQRLIAGLGNLLCDEIIWRCRLHLLTSVVALKDRNVGGLHGTMRIVLSVANRHARVPGKPGWLTGVRDQRDARCPRCRTNIRRTRVGGRTTCWCPRCQRE